MTQEITTESIVRADFDNLIEKVGHKIFNDMYYTKEEVLGICISKYFEWSLEPLVDVFKAGLEDSNFHDVESKVQNFINDCLDKQKILRIQVE